MFFRMADHKRIIGTGREAFCMCVRVSFMSTFRRANKRRRDVSSSMFVNKKEMKKTSAFFLFGLKFEYNLKVL